MTVAEMKLKAIEAIQQLASEEELQKALAFLEKVKPVPKVKCYHLSQHFDTIRQQYDSTLKKLAQ